MKCVSKELFGFILEMKCVSKELFGFILEMKCVSKELFGFILEMKCVSKELFGFILEMKCVSKELFGFILEMKCVCKELFGFILEMKCKEFLAKWFPDLCKTIFTSDPMKWKCPSALELRCTACRKGLMWRTSRKTITTLALSFFSIRVTMTSAVTLGSKVMFWATHMPLALACRVNSAAPCVPYELGEKTTCWPQAVSHFLVYHKYNNKFHHSGWILQRLRSVTMVTKTMLQMTAKCYHVFC